MKLELPRMASSTPAVGDVIHLPVEQVRLLDGPDVHLSLDPVGALPGNALLLKFVGKFQAVGVDDEGLSSPSCSGRAD